MISWGFHLALFGSGDAIPQHFEDVVDEYAVLEEGDERLLDCSWSLTHHPGASTGEVTVEITVSGSDPQEAYGHAVTAIRTAVHAAGGHTPDWESALPDGAPFTAALGPAEVLPV